MLTHFAHNTGTNTLYLWSSWRYSEDIAKMCCTHKTDCLLTLLTTLALTHYICEAAEDILKILPKCAVHTRLTVYRQLTSKYSGSQVAKQMFNLYNNIHEKTASSRGWMVVKEWSCQPGLVSDHRKDGWLRGLTIAYYPNCVKSYVTMQNHNNIKQTRPEK